MADAATLSRRQFFNTAVNAIGAVITAVVAVPVAGYFIDPALKKASGAANWVKLASASELSTTPTAFTLTAERVEGFMKQKVNATVYAFTGADGKPVAMSNICTHLGCPVSWTNNEFFCPCHGSHFNQDGTVKAGPAPKALPTFAAKIENGDLYIEVV
ncbi:MAG: ubiquinol-cytochrome c reductase iron-sulfur subunit [Candidatus Sericytochromatia bacterium]